MAAMGSATADATEPQLEGYKILSRLSTGGMGEVYLAEDPKLHRKVAIKVLTPEWADDPDRLQRFQWEARVLAKLNHPNIVTIYSVEEESELHYLTMELVEGKTLSDLIPAKGLPLERIFEIAVPLADALAAAHDRDIIHRDLKPGNVMVSRDGRVKVLDFGLAKRHPDGDAEEASELGAEQPVTRDGQMLGTIPYMAPEQLQGETVDHRADIFSLGIILFEMCTGERPFQGKTWGDLASSILRDQPSSVTVLNAALPRHLGRIIRHCLEKEPQRRFQTALDLRNELEALQRELHAEELSAIHSRTGIQILRPRRRNHEKWVALAATLVIVAALAVLVWGRFLRRDEPASPPGRPPPFEVTSDKKRIVVLPLENLGPAEDAYFAAGITEEITSRLASVSALQVISRTTALHYEQTDKTVQEIGRDLGVDYLLEGTVRWSTDAVGASRVRVTPQLIRVADDTHVWSTRYDRVIDDIFEVQSEIAIAVIAQLDVALLEPERQALVARKPTENVDAYQAYLRGMGFTSRRDPRAGNWELAVEQLERAVELDPGFALAYADLSEVHSLMVHWIIDDSEERLDMARVAVDQALALDPDLPQAHRALGYYYYWGYQDYEAALAEFAIAARDLPNDRELLEGISYIRRRQGRWQEAAVQLEKALALNPRSPWLASALGRTYTRMRRYADADRMAYRAQSVEPDNPLHVHERAHNTLLWKGALDEARAMLETMPRQRRAIAILAWYDLERLARHWPAALGRIDAFAARVLVTESANYPKEYLRGVVLTRMGDEAGARQAYEAAREVLETQLAGGADIPRVHSALGLVYACLGRHEEAVREGRRAVEQYPIAQDAFTGADYLQHLAAIYAEAGEHDAAVRQIEYLLSIPSNLSAAMLRLDPRWDPLRKHPGFERLVAPAADGP